MSQWKDKTVGVLMGGVSREREVSLRTGTAIANALESAGYHVKRIDVGYDAPQQILHADIDVAFIALHGTYGEDGSIQGVLEYMRIPYTGSSVTGSAVAMDKVLSKAVARQHGIRVAGDQVVCVRDDASWAEQVQCNLQFPVIVKPAREGSTIGMHIVQSAGELPAALRSAGQHDQKLLIEEFVEGAEVTVGILDGEVLPSIEIIPDSGFYDYTAKYTKGATEYVIPARIPEAVRDQLASWTRELWVAMECSGVARADYIVPESGAAVLLEINTIPGMTETSLVPKAAHQAGKSFTDVCETILRTAKCHMKGDCS